jgi:hypothetical protein
LAIVRRRMQSAGSRWIEDTTSPTEASSLPEILTKPCTRDWREGICCRPSRLASACSRVRTEAFGGGAATTVCAKDCASSSFMARLSIFGSSASSATATRRGSGTMDGSAASSLTPIFSRCRRATSSSSFLGRM